MREEEQMREYQFEFHQPHELTDAQWIWNWEQLFKYGYEHPVTKKKKTHTHRMNESQLRRIIDDCPHWNINLDMNCMIAVGCVFEIFGNNMMQLQYPPHCKYMKHNGEFN